jgi:peptide/nickel transport system substrate-binding protein
MRRIAYRFLAAVSVAGESGGGGPHARPSQAQSGVCLRLWRLSIRQVLLIAVLAISAIAIATAETRPHYGGTLRVMLQSAPVVLELPANAAPADYWDLSRTLSLIGDTLIKLDAQDLPRPSLAVTWQIDASARHWQFTLRRGVKFHDGSAASPAAIAQVLGALHPNWIVRAAPDSITIESDAPMPSLLAELSLPRNLLLKRGASGVPIGTGAFVVAEWQPEKLLKLAAYEESWAGRPFVDAVEIEFGKSQRDQSLYLELDKTDIIEVMPQAANGSQPHGASWSSSSSSLPVELLALVFSPSPRVQDPRLREALALAIDRKPIQSVLLKGAGEPTASILPNWMTGYSAVFSAQANPQLAKVSLTGSRQSSSNPSYGLNYDPRDPQAQLIAERIALNAREVGITVQLSLSGAADIRLMRVVLPSPDPATSLVEAARQMGLPQTVSHEPRPNSLDDLYQSERTLLDEYSVIPLFHLPLESAASARVRGWEPDRLGEWNAPASSLADLWLADPRQQPRPFGPQPAAGLR